MFAGFNTFHDLFDASCCCIGLVLGNLEQQFIVHLQQHQAVFESGIFQRSRNLDHSALDDVGG